VVRVAAVMISATIAAITVVVGLALRLPSVASTGSPVVRIEDWTAVAVGTHGVPPRWRGESFGKGGAVDFTVVTDEGRPALRMRSHDDRSTIAKDLGRRFRLKATPILEWQWKVVTLPGVDARRRKTTDQAAQIYVVWPHFPALLRSRIIGYVWDTSAPAGGTVRNRKTGAMVTYIIVRTGPSQLGRWLTEQRDVWADYMAVYGERPESPSALSLSIDSDDTHTSAEALIGVISFHAP
jgi:hypothetical protein